MDETYPIDIHYNKLLGRLSLMKGKKWMMLVFSGTCTDWLISRRHCNHKWHVQAKEVRSRVAMAIKDLPQDHPQLLKMLQDDRGVVVGGATSKGVAFFFPAGLNYFDCQVIVDILKEVDGDAKSLFGQYTAPRVKV